jgi:hypothetical protein
MMMEKKEVHFFKNINQGKNKRNWQEFPKEVEGDLNYY